MILREPLPDLNHSPEGSGRFVRQSQLLEELGLVAAADRQEPPVEHRIAGRSEGPFGEVHTPLSLCQRFMVPAAPVQEATHVVDRAPQVPQVLRVCGFRHYQLRLQPEGIAIQANDSSKFLSFVCLRPRVVSFGHPPLCLAVLRILT